MSIRRSRAAIAALAVLTVSSCLSACTPSPTPEPLPSGPSDDDVRTDHLSAISVGTEDRVVEVRVDEEITIWLNTVDESSESSSPTPEADAWHPFTMPSGGSSVIFDTGLPTSFDVLEILAYPEGLDDEGVPVSVAVYPLCGPQAERSCKDLASSDTSVEIPSETVEAAIADTEYYAIGGILLPLDDSHPDSFMALLRKQGADDDSER